MSNKTIDYQGKVRVRLEQLESKGSCANYYDVISWMQRDIQESLYKNSKDEETESNWDILKGKIYFLIGFILRYIIFLFLYYPFTVVIYIISLVILVFKCQFKKLPHFALVMINCISVLYLQYMTVTKFRGDSIERFWFINAMIFYLSSIMVISYLQICDTKFKEISQAIPCFDIYSSKTSNTMFILPQEENDKNYFYSFDFDYLGSLHISYQYLMNDLRIEGIRQFYSYFSLQSDPVELKHLGSELITNFPEPVDLNMWQYFLFIVLIFTKACMCLIYMFMHNMEFTAQTETNIILTTLFYVYTAWNLNRMLGNYDLQRKSRLLIQLNDLVDFSQIKLCANNEILEKIDITCSISVETWDNSRKFLFNTQKEKLETSKLRMYIFVSIICITAFGEFYWIIPEESIYLHPLVVIQNTVDFVLLNIIIFFRIWEGQKYNDAFGELEGNIDRLIDMTQDLLQMFDSFFISNISALGPEEYEIKVKFEKISNSQKKSKVKDQQNNDEAENNQYEYKAYRVKKELENDNSAQDPDSKKRVFNSPYELITQRIKNLSEYYIEKQGYYQGNTYSQQTKRNLQKKILKNMLSTFNKVKQQIKIDYEAYSYKFLNTFRVQFSETVTTIVIAIITLLPNIIPKFIKMFSEEAS